jgi:hypothetical protein
MDSRALAAKHAPSNSILKALHMIDIKRRDFLKASAALAGAAAGGFLKPSVVGGVQSHPPGAGRGED